jgi:hypothetical protein
MIYERPRFESLRQAGLVSCVLLCACQSTGGVRETLDARTGSTWSTDRAPVVYARTEARYSRSARDYLYLGPVEINRQGTRDYYLWVGVATTLDRGYLAPAMSLPNMLYVELGGEVMEFPLQPWSSLTPLPSAESVYPTTVDIEAELGARVASSQIARLAAELPAALRVAVPSKPTREYRRWDDGAVWPGFAARLEPVRSVSGTAAAQARSSSAANSSTYGRRSR